MFLVHSLKNIYFIDFRAGFQVSLKRECAQHLWRTLSGKMSDLVRIQNVSLDSFWSVCCFVAMVVCVSVGPRETRTPQWPWAITSAQPWSVTGKAHSTPPNSPQTPMESWSLLGPARDTAMWVPLHCGWAVYELYELYSYRYQWIWITWKWEIIE